MLLKGFCKSTSDNYFKQLNILFVSNVDQIRVQTSIKYELLTQIKVCNACDQMIILWPTHCDNTQLKNIDR